MASINLQGDTSGSITLSAPSVAGSSVLTLPATTQTLATQNSLGVRNLIINGDMRIDQRNAGASLTPANQAYGLDRWKNELTQSSKFSVQQSTTAPVGFVNSMLITSLSAYSVTSTDQFNIGQYVEGFNVANLGWGTANAATVTLSFWTRSSLTGTFGGALNNAAGNRSYPFSYTISSANTWEYKTITISGDTTGTWVTNNGVGIRVCYSLGSGSTISSTANAWAGAFYIQPTGSTSLLGTNGATLYITGVQLEVGDTATPFEHRPYDMELARCQRYFERIAGDANVAYASGCATYGNQPRTVLFYKTQKRAVPTLSSSAASEFRFQFNNSVNTPSAITLASIGVDTAFLNATGITISVNVPCVLISNSLSSYLDFSSEL